MLTRTKITGIKIIFSFAGEPTYLSELNELSQLTGLKAPVHTVGRF